MPVEERRVAVGAFIERYHAALSAYIHVVVASVSAVDADDIVQSFTVDKLLAGNLINQVDPKRGRLRDLLRTACRNYCRSELRKLPKQTPLLDEKIAEAESSAEHVFEKGWAELVALSAESRVKARFMERGQTDYWRVLEARVIDPAFGRAPQVSYEVLAHELGLRNDQLRNRLAKAKDVFGRCLREVVAEYADTTDAIDDELAELMRLLDC